MIAKRKLVTLTGLPGVRRRHTSAVLIRSVTAAAKELKAGNSITAANDCGALNVWKADDGLWRCELMRNRVPVASKQYRTLAAVCQWIKDALRYMRAEP